MIACGYCFIFNDLIIMLQNVIKMLRVVNKCIMKSDLIRIHAEPDEIIFCYLILSLIKNNMLILSQRKEIILKLFVLCSSLCFLTNTLFTYARLVILTSKQIELDDYMYCTYKKTDQTCWNFQFGKSVILSNAKQFFLK